MARPSAVIAMLGTDMLKEKVYLKTECGKVVVPEGRRINASRRNLPK